MKNLPGWEQRQQGLTFMKAQFKTVTLKSTVQVLSWIEASVILLQLSRPVWHCGNGFLAFPLLHETGGALSSSCICVNGLFFIQCHVRPVAPFWLEKDWVLRLWTMHFLRLARLFYCSSSCSLTCPWRCLLQRLLFFFFFPPIWLIGVRQDKTSESGSHACDCLWKGKQFEAARKDQKLSFGKCLCWILQSVQVQFCVSKSAWWKWQISMGNGEKSMVQISEPGNLK